MLAITQMPNFGFGNKLLYYFNLRQKAYLDQVDFHCVFFDGLDLFAGNMQGSKLSGDFETLSPCLGEKFFEKNPLNSVKTFQLNSQSELIEKKCSIHFRGTDFHTWNPDSILPHEYYISAIEEISGEVDNFVLLTDDQNLESYKKTLEFLESRKICYSKGENTSDRERFKTDFVTMCGSDFIISSPSTFCISAGFSHKRKKIIHSKSWITSRILQRDNFWVNLWEGGNDNYKIWKTF